MKSLILKTSVIQEIIINNKNEIEEIIDNEEIGNPYYRLDNFKYFIENFAKHKIDDELYVRETWTYGEVTGLDDDYGEVERWLEQTQQEEDKEAIFYKADMDMALDDEVSFEDVFWKSSTQMPKEYARLFLKIKNIYVKNLADNQYSFVYEFEKDLKNPVKREKK